MTIPRAPVFAAYTSPGPKYKLPTLTGSREHDIYSLYTKAPSFAFGSRHKQFPVSGSPGPKLSQTAIYRDGVEGSPKYSLKSRIKQRRTDCTPSPVVYNLEKSKSQVYNNAPQYSISLPRRSHSVDFTPAPKYDLPTMMCETKQSTKRRAPAYSMRPKNSWMPAPESPGPAVYNVISTDIYRNKAPIYSVYFRNKTWDTRIEKTPGPGTHSPETVWVHKKKAPQPTFGIRHSMYITPLWPELSEWNQLGNLHRRNKGKKYLLISNRYHIAFLNVNNTKCCIKSFVSQKSAFNYYFIISKRCWKVLGKKKKRMTFFWRAKEA